jgi:hypothetical protein
MLTFAASEVARRYATHADPALAKIRREVAEFAYDQDLAFEVEAGKVRLDGWNYTDCVVVNAYRIDEEKDSLALLIDRPVLLGTVYVTHAGIAEEQTEKRVPASVELDPETMVELPL